MGKLLEMFNNYVETKGGIEKVRLEYSKFKLNMIKENLNKLIMDAMKSHDNIGTSVLRTIKTAILNWETAKENVGKVFSEADEINILKKVKSQYEETAIACNDGKHDELVKEATEQAKYVEQFLPKPVTEEEINEAIKNSNISLEKKNMGLIIKYVKEVYPVADGKLVADCVKKHLN